MVCICNFESFRFQSSVSRTVSNSILRFEVCWSTNGRQLADILVDNWPTLGRQLVDNWPTLVGRQLVDNWSTVGRHLVDKWPTIGRQLALVDKWSTIGARVCVYVCRALSNLSKLESGQNHSGSRLENEESISSSGLCNVAGWKIGQCEAG